MVKNQELHVAIEFSDYKLNKSNILNSKIDALNVMRGLQTMRQLKEEKAKLKQRLFVLCNQTLQAVQRLENKMPDVKQPKLLKTTQEKSEEIFEVKTKRMVNIDPEIEAKKQSIDDELRSIQEKLKIINSY